MFVNLLSNVLLIMKQFSMLSVVKSDIFWHFITITAAACTWRLPVCMVYSHPIPLNKHWLSYIFSILIPSNTVYHDDVINWKHFPRYWPFVRGIHSFPVNSPQKASDAEFWCLYTPHQRSWEGGILLSPCPSVHLSICPSVDRIVSALYLLSSVSE